MRIFKIQRMLPDGRIEKTYSRTLPCRYDIETLIGLFHTDPVWKELGGLPIRALRSSNPRIHPRNPVAEFHRFAEVGVMRPLYGPVLIVTFQTVAERDAFLPMRERN